MTFCNAYHVGIVVADLDTTTEELTDLLGVQWAHELHRNVNVKQADGTVSASLRYTFSLPSSGSTLLEVIEGPEDTLWYPGDGVPWAFHHIGFWSEDLKASTEALIRGGANMEATEAVESPLFAYHQLQHGPLVELVDVARRDSFNEWLGSH